jgi:hypothetical protein
MRSRRSVQPACSPFSSLLCSFLGVKELLLATQEPVETISVE